MMKKYLFKQAQSIHATLTDKDGKETDIALHEGEIAELPSDNAYIITLVARGFLQEVKDGEATATDDAVVSNNKKANK
jgi:hypothetical protein